MKLIEIKVELEERKNENWICPTIRFEKFDGNGN